MKPLLSRAVDNLDLSLAALGCLLAIPVIIHLHAVLRDPVYSPVGWVVLFACAGYLLLKRRSPPSIRIHAPASPRMYLLLNTLFFSLLTYSVAALHLRPDLYTRPLGYFVALAAMATVVAIEILFLPSRRAAAWFALFKIMVIALSLVFSQLLVYPSIVGVDPWEHQSFTTRILDAGHIPPGFLYSELPGMPLLSGATSLITGLNYKMATMLSVSLLQVVCNVLFVFLLGRFAHSTKAGLLAALILGVADWHLRFAYWAIPNSMAVIFIPIVIYLLLKARQDTPKTSIGLSALLIAALVLTHTVAVVMLVIAFFSIWLGLAVYRRLTQEVVPEARVFAVAGAVLIVAGLVYWTAISGHTSVLVRLLEDFREGILGIFGLGSPSPPAELTPLQRAVAEHRNQVVPVGEHLLNNIGYFLFFGLSLIGIFAMLSHSIRTSRSYAVAIGGLMILSLTLFVVFPLRGWLAGRFNYFLQIVLAVPLSLALLWLAGLPVRRVARAFLVGVVVLALSFLMTMSLQANLDNRSLSPNTIVRYGFAVSELEAMTTAATLHRGRVATDRVYGHLEHLPAMPGRIRNICMRLHSRDFTGYEDDLILIRDEIVVHPFMVLGLAPYRLAYDPRITLTELGFSRVYDCKTVSGFIYGDSGSER